MTQRYDEVFEPLRRIEFHNPTQNWLSSNFNQRFGPRLRFNAQANAAATGKWPPSSPYLAKPLSITRREGPSVRRPAALISLCLPLPPAVATGPSGGRIEICERIDGAELQESQQAQNRWTK